MKKLKIGIIVDNMTVPKYYLDYINQLSEEYSFFDEPVIINQKINSQNNSDANLFIRLVKKIYKDGLASVIQSLFSRIIFFEEYKLM